MEKENISITIREASQNDLSLIEAFLSRPEIDTLFTPPLSDPVRGMTIQERVKRKFTTGVWIIAVYENQVVGVVAIVPSKLRPEIKAPVSSRAISLGVSFRDWNAEKIM